MTFVAPAGDPRRTTAQAGRSPTAVYSPYVTRRPQSSDPSLSALRSPFHNRVLQRCLVLQNIDPRGAVHSTLQQKENT